MHAHTRTHIRIHMPGGHLDGLLPALAAHIGRGGQWAGAAVAWELSAAVLMAGWKCAPAPELQPPPGINPDAEAMDEDDEVRACAL